jgi:hypothetical protein
MKPTIWSPVNAPKRDTAIVGSRDEQVRRNYLCLAARPDDTLELFSSGHIFGGFEQADKIFTHFGSRVERTIFCILDVIFENSS